MVSNTIYKSLFAYAAWLNKTKKKNLEHVIYNCFYSWFLFGIHNMRRTSHLRENRSRNLQSRGIKIKKATKDWATKKYRMTVTELMWLLNYSTSNNKENLIRIKEILEYDKKVIEEMKSLKEHIDDIISEVYLPSNDKRVLGQIH